MRELEGPDSMWSEDEPLGLEGTGPCPCCGSRASMGALKAPKLSYRLCSSCGSGRLTTHIPFEAYYEDYFPEGVQRDSPVVQSRYRDLLARFEKHTSGRSLLEVGCGNGQLLAVAKERGWTVAGTELSRVQAEHGRARGLRVEYGDLLRNGLFKGETFDAAVLIEVFEHLPDPVAMLDSVHARLASGGVLYLTTPNFASLSRKLLGGRWSVLDSEHVLLATPKGLRAALASAGFETRSLKSRNLNLSELRYHLRRLGELTRSRGRGALVEVLDRPREAAELRDRIEGSRMLRGVKTLVNAGLGLTRTGDTLVAWARRP